MQGQDGWGIPNGESLSDDSGQKPQGAGPGFFPQLQ